MTLIRHSFSAAAPFQNKGPHFSSSLRLPSPSPKKNVAGKNFNSNAANASKSGNPFLAALVTVPVTALLAYQQFKLGQNTDALQAQVDTLLHSGRPISEFWQSAKAVTLGAVGALPIAGLFSKSYFKSLIPELTANVDNICQAKADAAVATGLAAVAP